MGWRVPPVAYRIGRKILQSITQAGRRRTTGLREC